MCENCYVIKELLIAAESNSHQNYLPVIAFLREMVIKHVIDLYAGDCPLDEVEKHLSDEIHYTIRHYFKCRSCSQYFLVGACIRGMPVFETIKKIEIKTFDSLWGKFGTFYV